MNRLKYFAGISFLGCYVLLVCAVQIMILNKDSTQGETLTTLYKDMQVLDQETTTLRQHIASFSALTAIRSQSDAYGFVPSPKTITITSSFPLASTNRQAF